MKFRALVAFGAIAMSSVLTADAQQSQQLSIATGGTGGVYYPLGGGFGSILGKTSGRRPRRRDRGSVANLKLVAGKADLCFTQSIRPGCITPDKFTTESSAPRAGRHYPTRHV